MPGADDLDEMKTNMVGNLVSICSWISVERLEPVREPTTISHDDGTLEPRLHQRVRKCRDAIKISTFGEGTDNVHS
jgi:hypothetical protein